MSSQRPRIIPWLITQIDSQRYPGLQWVNAERTQFRIPWKHALRQDLSLEDFKIFEAWAIASGCYNPTTDKPDPARWKRNFRSALLTREGICMTQDFSSDSNEPHKIYQITRGANAFPAEQYASSSGSPTLQPPDSNSQQAGGTMPPHANVSAESELAGYCQGEDGLYLSLGDLHSTIDEIGSDAVSSPQVYVDGAVAAPNPVCSDATHPVYSDALPSASSGIPVVVQPQPAQEPGNLKQRILTHFANNAFETDFEVKMFYRGNQVHKTTVKNPRGFYITAGDQTITGSYLEHVALPQPATCVTDQLLVKAVNMLLSKLEQGTLVEVRGGLICAKRTGHCRSYWSMTDTPTTNVPNQIDKSDYSVLYSVHQFVTELIEFLEHRRKESPQYNIWICLGEQWPDGVLWNKKCIMVQITPVVMALLHEMSYSAGASSLIHSDVNLEISDSMSGSDLLSFLKDIEMMDWS
ncbi:interferon regulatory factor 3-like isoform X2 [Mixophyes fleayi]|uniref:interferon regulatory factor 3-like isoform X2 n=1 Tax=Mixophyes fleayi TaxID=3061075 RepID=UPI003F4DA3B2